MKKQEKSKQKRYKKYNKQEPIKRKPIKCNNCGKLGHFAKQCYAKKKEKINALIELEDIPKDLLKTYLYEIIDENENIHSCTKHNCKCLNSSTDYYSLQSSDSSSDIYVLTSEEKLLLDTIENIENKETRKECLLKTLETLKGKNKQTQEISYQPPYYDYGKILKRTTKQTNISSDELYKEINFLKERVAALETQTLLLEEQLEKFETTSIQIIQHFEDLFKQKNTETIDTDPLDSEQPIEFINCIQKPPKEKWYIQTTILLKDFQLKIPALIDSGADINCIQEKLIPVKFYAKTSHKVNSANGAQLDVTYKISNVTFCIKKYYVNSDFILIRHMNQQAILGLPFLQSLIPFLITCKGIRKEEFFLEFL